MSLVLTDQLKDSLQHKHQVQPHTLVGTIKILSNYSSKTHLKMNMEILKRTAASKFQLLDHSITWTLHLTTYFKTDF